MSTIKNKVIAVWFSCGAASAVAAKKTIEKYGTNNTVRVINNPVKEEDDDNQRFLLDVEKWLGIKIEKAINPKYPSCSIADTFVTKNGKGYMSGIYGAPCTLHLKKKARQHWESENHHDYIVLGFTSDEQKRHDRFALNERSNILPVLIDAKISKADCYLIIQDAGLTLPRIYKQGYPNANCIGCVKATSVTYWNHVRKMHPEVFKDRAVKSREYGTKLVRLKGKRIFLDELPPDAVGRPMKNMEVECGIFCDMK